MTSWQRRISALGLMAWSVLAGAQQPEPPARNEPPIHGAVWLAADGANLHESLPVERLIDELRAAPFQDVIIQVVDGGAALFRSERLPRSAGLSQSFDPLARLLAGLNVEPRRRTVVAWVDPLRMGNVQSASSALLLRDDPTRVQWLTRTVAGETHAAEGNRYLEAGLPEVRALMAAAVGELVSRYELAAIHFEPLRDPGAEWGYHHSVLERWQQETGQAQRPEPEDPRWIEFRARLLTELLEELVKAARAARPGIQVSVAAEAFGPAPESLEQFHESAVYREARQDWPVWLASGLVDRVVLRNFREEESEAGEFDGWLELALAADQAAEGSVLIGVAGHMNGSIPTLRQLQRAALAGAEGVALADFQRPTRDPGVRSLFFSAVAETALSRTYVARMHQIAQPRNPATPAGDGSEVALELPPPPGQLPVEDGQGRLIPIDNEGGAERDVLEDARRLAGMPPEATAATEMQVIQPDAPPVTRREMLVELLKNPEFRNLREPQPIRGSSRAEEYLRNRYEHIFQD